MKQCSLFVFAIPLISLLINILTLSHYGINWDEPYHYRRGQAFLQYFLTGSKIYNNMPKYPPLKGDSDNPDFRDGQKIFEAVQKDPTLADTNFRRSIYQDDSWDGRFFIDTENTYGHPAFNDLIAALFNKIFYQKLGIMGDLESYKFFPVFVVSIAGVFIVYFMLKEFGIIESIFASVFFFSYPLLLAEQHFDVKDPVETAFYTITILASYWGLKKNNFRWLLVSVLSFAMAFSTKFNIVFSVFPILIWFIFYIFKTSERRERLFIKIGLCLLIAPLVCLGILVASYPTLWKDPANGVAQIVKFYLEVGYPASTSYGYYFFNFFNALPSVWIIVTTPPIEILLLAIAILSLPRLIKRNDFMIILFVWLFIVVGRNSFFKALNYGGVRLIMEYIPALVMIAAIAAGYLVNLKKSKIYLVITFLALFLFLAPSLIKVAAIHPNENEYFNFLIRGLSGAKNENIPDWGNSDGNAYFGGVSWLNKNAALNAKVSTPIGNTSNIPRIKLRSDIALSPYYWSGLKHDGEYLIELTYDYVQMKWFALKYLNEAMAPVYEVKVDGVAIAKVWKNDLQHVRAEFLNQKKLRSKITVDKEKKKLSVYLPAVSKVMKVTITHPTEGCTQLHTGYVTSTVDEKNYVREEEDIAVDQLNRDAKKQIGNIYEYYFVATPAKILTFNVDSETTCLLKATKAEVDVLND